MNDDSLLFFRMIRDFLNIYLPQQKGASANTVKSYKIALNLLIDYTKESLCIPISDVSFCSITRKHMEDFLEWLEVKKGCSISTRNQRLSCVRSFYTYAGGRNITIMSCLQEVSKIPLKKEADHQGVKYFSENALKTILEQADITKRLGIRDLFFMILMYDTAARNQEILDLRVIDVHASQKAPYIIITGKGHKTRLVPIMEKTVKHLENYLKIFHQESDGNAYLFYTMRNGEKMQMSPDNSEQFIKKYGELARERNSDVPDNIHPHMFRHSRAMHLYRGGMPLPLLSEWLGHAQLETTLIYANADINMKQDAIKKATSSINPLKTSERAIDWQNDEEMIKKLYGLV